VIAAAASVDRPRPFGRGSQADGSVNRILVTLLAALVIFWGALICALVFDCCIGSAPP
jgi:hypothetical protein